ncbi:acetoacetate decarboxylase family protein [Aeromicrobium choanae]|uniref:Acetoacetate decarboxylase n=1 Tax=Aeromicrobium choanae TaxID=1736691 RepID=A0A1T4YXJ8_9ACTN|nr:acetoacetate decarboxylase family protein [Aeromicrobium choanae]SKB06373.1 acetoacetate decarboxylase [Aeromicrobium choanae]
MGYVKSAEELAGIEAQFAPSRHISEAVSVPFVTEPEFIREILPPCFSPADEPVGTLLIGRQVSGRGPYEGYGIHVAARFGEIEGSFIVSMVLDLDMPVVLGRERWGEPKKYGPSEMAFEGRSFRGSTSRNGVALVEVTAEFTDELPDLDTEGTALELKMMMAAEGPALHSDPIVLVDRGRATHRSRRRGTAEVRLSGSPTDPLGDLPIVSWGEATYSYSDSENISCEETVLHGADHAAYLPFLHGRYYDAVAGDFRQRFTPSAVFA